MWRVTPTETCLTAWGSEMDVKKKEFASLSLKIRSGRGGDVMTPRYATPRPFPAHLICLDVAWYSR